MTANEFFTAVSALTSLLFVAGSMLALRLGLAIAHEVNRADVQRRDSTK
jgi:hypothetical protein